MKCVSNYHGSQPNPSYYKALFVIYSFYIDNRTKCTIYKHITKLHVLQQDNKHDLQKQKNMAQHI